MTDEPEHIAFRRWCSEREVLLSWEQLQAVEGKSFRARRMGQTYLKCLLTLFKLDKSDSFNVIYIVPQLGNYLENVKRVFDLVAPKVGITIHRTADQVLVADIGQGPSFIKKAIHIKTHAQLTVFHIPPDAIEIRDL